MSVNSKGYLSSTVKRHKLSKYFTLMLVPDDTSKKVRSLKIPHWFIYMVGGIIVSTGLIIGGLSILNSHSKFMLAQTAKMIEESEYEKQELLDEKQKIEVAKERIEKNLSAQQGDFNKQIEFYLDQIQMIEVRLIEIENQARENYRKMNQDGMPVSAATVESYMGGNYLPVFEEGVEDTDKLNMFLASLDVQFEKTEDFFNKYSQDVDKYVAFMAAMPNVWPVVGSVTSEFGGRRDPINGGAADHTGIDIKAPTGTPVKATGAGTVRRADHFGGYGNTVVIDHGNGIETLYAHNSQLLVKVGDRVKRGDIIARVGSTGRSTGPHVHYEVRVNGVPRNPRSYMR
jgi:biotin carboxyl carrier protein